MFKLTSQQPKNTRLTYVHQQLMLSTTSNKVIAIEYFKHECYHKVKCISKEIGYMNNRGTRRRWCIPEFLLFRGVRLVGEVWATTTGRSQCHKGFTFFSDELHHKRFGSPSTIGILRGGIRSLYNNNPGHNPQLNWGLPDGYKWPQKVSTTTKASRVQWP